MSFIPLPKDDLQGLVQNAEHYILERAPWYSNLANLAAFIHQSISELNWAGFYLRQKNTLFVGPFSGQPACTLIHWGRGVCGSAAAQGETLVVADVDKFGDHIVCDSASRSEVAIPLFGGDEVLGILDVDSPRLNRFDNETVIALEGVAQLAQRVLVGAKFGLE